MNVSDTTMQLMEAIEYHPDEPTRFFILDKDTGKHLATYSSPNFMFFHSVNAYDFPSSDNPAETTIHVDLCSYEGRFVPYREYCLSNILDPVQPFMDGTLVRYELASIESASPIPGKESRVTVAAAIPGIPMELPRINKRASMKPGYRYVYATGGNGGASLGTKVPIGRLGNGLKCVQAAFFSCIAKTDWHTGGFVTWTPPDGESCPCEPVFVSRPGEGLEEDDGVVLTIVIDREGTRSILVALDGRTLKEVARVPMPQVYGIGPHGSFIERKKMY